MRPLQLTLTGLASQYIHMPLAPWCLKRAVEDAGLPVAVTIADLNINDAQEDLLARIMATEPDVLGVSLYIWNRDHALRLIRRVKAVRPEIVVLVGGPEATFSPEQTLHDAPIDYLLRGAGEESLPALLHSLLNGGDTAVGYALTAEALQAENPFPPSPFDPANIPGVCFPTGNGLHLSAPAPAPAPRADLYDAAWQSALNGRMAYVETSRGCPFQCAFCLSGNKEAPDARQVQFMPVAEALALLIRLSQSGADTVKLIDRTFNCHRARTLTLLRGLIDAKNRGEIGDTCYHFEVAADLFDDETLALLATAPAGLFQMEAGLQSFHAPTLAACDRRTDMPRLVDRIQRILAPGNIHLHIDLIAGLPKEDFAAFGQSFDLAFELKPHQLQLGFLKLIHGSKLRQQDWGQRYAPDPPYEVLSTPWMSYAELRRLHDCAEAVERIHNSGRFTLAEALALQVTGMRPFGLYLLLGARMAARPGRWSLDGLTRLVHDTFLELGVPAPALRDAMIADRLATDNTGYLPPFLQGDPAALKTAARAYRDAHPGEKHPRIALRSDGAALVATWVRKHPVTGRGEVRRVPT